jgi:hypothetical protein
MWEVNDVARVDVRSRGVESTYGFNITNDRGKPLVLFAYATRPEAESAATHVRAAIKLAVEVQPYYAQSLR